MEYVFPNKCPHCGEQIEAHLLPKFKVQVKKEDKEAEERRVQYEKLKQKKLIKTMHELEKEAVRQSTKEGISPNKLKKIAAGLSITETDQKLILKFLYTDYQLVTLENGNYYFL